MKKFRLKSSILAGLAALFLSVSAWRTGSITDITKPYVGEYICKSAVYGEKDLLDHFSYIDLLLNGDDTFVLRYQEKDGKARKEEGTYEYDAENNTIRFAIHGKREVHRDFRIENGQILISLKMGGKTLALCFEQK